MNVTVDTTSCLSSIDGLSFTQRASLSFLEDGYYRLVCELLVVTERVIEPSWNQMGTEEDCVSYLQHQIVSDPVDCLL